MFVVLSYLGGKFHLFTKWQCFYNLSGFGIYVILKTSYSPKGHLVTMKEKAIGITSALTPDLSNT